MRIPFANPGSVQPLGQELGGGSVSLLPFLSLQFQAASPGMRGSGGAESKYSIIGHGIPTVFFRMKTARKIVRLWTEHWNCTLPAIDGFFKKSLWRRNYDFSITFLDRDSDSLGKPATATGTSVSPFFAPRDTWNPAATNGITVETIAHELGHAFHDALEYHYGMDELRETWERLNAGYDMAVNGTPALPRFFSYEYGMTDYYEDVATVFENLAAYPSVTQARPLVQTDCEPLYLKAKFPLYPDGRVL